MIKVEVSIQIQRAAGDIFAYISDFENNPQWQSGMVACRFTSEGPLRIGSSYVQEARFLGRTIESTFEVLEYEPGRMVKAGTTGGSFPISFQRWVEPQADGSSLVSASITGDASGFFRLAEPLMRPMVQRQIEGDYANLKRIMESPGPKS
jgi:uncharacterized membrane protein